MNATLNYHEESGQPPTNNSELLFLATKLGDSNAVHDLIVHGADVNAEGGGGNTPLMTAASFGQVEVLRLLQEHGAAINKLRDDGFSALTLAVFFGHEEVVRELLTRGADINTSKGATTPEMWAIARGFPKIAGLLRESRDLRDKPNPVQTSSTEIELYEGFSRNTAELTVDDNEFFEGEGLRKLNKGQSTTAAAPAININAQTTTDEDSFEKGIRKVGQTQWTTSVVAEIKPEACSLDSDELFEEGIRQAGETEWTNPTRSDKPWQETIDADEFFEEGIRRVGQDKWITTTENSVDTQTADADEFFDCIRQWSDDSEHQSKEKISPVTKSSIAITPSTRKEVRESVREEQTEKAVLWSEGIRKVGQAKEGPTNLVDSTEYIPPVTTGSFSAFSALSERLGINVKNVAVMTLLLLAVAAFGSVVFMQQQEVEQQTATETSPVVTPEQPSAVANQATQVETPQLQQASTTSPEQATIAAAETSAAIATDENTVVTNSPAKEEAPSVGTPDVRQGLGVQKTAAADRRKAPAPIVSSSQRQKVANRNSEKTETAKEVSSPAAITFVPSEPDPRRNSPGAAKSQSTSVIGGSSPKKKVIQWP